MYASIVYPENKKQLPALKVVMKSMKVNFVERNEIYPDHVIEGINASLRQADERQLIPYTGLKDMLR